MSSKHEATKMRKVANDVERACLQGFKKNRNKNNILDRIRKRQLKFPEHRRGKWAYRTHPEWTRYIKEVI